MKLLYKPLFRYSVLLTILGATLALIVSLLLPNQDFSPTNLSKKETQISFKVAKAFDLQRKQQQKKPTPKKVASASEFLLKAFAINSIFLSGDESMVIIRNPKGGIFLSLNKSYKGYKLIKVYPQKAKFQKGINYYWAFLNPDDEKAFQKTPHATAPKVATKKSSSIRTTTARKMFEQIKYKNGKYYIPQDTLYEYANMEKIFSNIGIQMYSINGVLSFKVNYIKSSSVFYKIGLRRGDRIIKLNNLPFKSASQPIKIFQNLKNLKQLELTIRRGNKTKELQYEVY